MRFHLVAGLLLAGFCMALPAHAAQVVYHVSTTADSGPGSLRQALIDGNALAGQNDYPHIYIDLPASQPIMLQSALPTISNPIAFIEGSQSTRATISGSANYPIFNTGTGALLVSFTNLKLMQGAGSSGACLFLGDGSGIYSITNVAFTQCVASNGGGALFAAGTTTVRDSRFSGNRVDGSATAEGGAIMLYGSGSALTVENSRFFSNSVQTDTSSQYQPARGGAIYVYNGSLSVNDSVFSGNHASSTNYPANTAGGAITVNAGSTQLRRDTFYNGSAGDGGAVAFYTSNPTNITLTLANNSFVGNVAAQNWGGAVVTTGDLILRNNSFFFNAANATGDNIRGYNFPGVPNPVIESAWNNLFTAGFGAQDSCVGIHSATASGYNIVPLGACGLGLGTGSRITTNVHLIGYRVPPYDPTMLRFTVDGPALDAGNPAAPDDSNLAACPTVDGLGEARALDGNADGSARCDIGALEWQHEAPLFIDDFEDRIQP